MLLRMSEIASKRFQSRPMPKSLNRRLMSSTPTVFLPTATTTTVPSRPGLGSKRCASRMPSPGDNRSSALLAQEERAGMHVADGGQRPRVVVPAEVFDADLDRSNGVFE